MCKAGRLHKRDYLRASIFAFAMLPCALHADSPSQVVEHALLHNLEIASAQASMQASSFDKSISITEFLPEISASANTSWNESNTKNEPGPDIENQYNENGYRLTLTQTLIDLGRLFRFSQANKDYGIERLKYEQTRQDIISKTISSYIEVLKLYARKHTTDLERESSEAQVEQLRKNVEAGNTARSSLYEAQAKLSRVLSSLVDLETRISVALQRLSKDSGYRAWPSFDIQPDMEIRSIDATMESIYLDQLQAQNFDVLIARENLDKRKSSLNEKRSSFAPTVTADINYSFTDTNNASANAPPATGESDSTSYRLSVNLPLFKGGERFFDIGKAKHLTDKSQIDLDNALQDASLELQELVLNINAGANRVEILKTSIVANYESYRGQKRAYELGTRTLSDLLSAEQLLYDSVRDYFDTKYDYVNDLIELRALLGTLSQEVIDTISGKMIERNPRERRSNLEDLLATIAPGDAL